MMSTPTKAEPQLAGTYSLSIRGQTFDFLGSRTVFWRETSTLLAADLHWGKVEVFQRHGVPVPKGVLADDLKRLSSALETTKASRLLILGDLIHATSGLTPDVIDDVAAWRSKHDVYFHLILGNHDKRFVAPPPWRIDEISNDVQEDSFLFTHDHVKESEFFVWSGHLHPVARVHFKGGDSVRLPCYLVKKDSAFLPAFSFFTGGVEVSRKNEDENLLVIADEQVFKI